MTTALDLYLYIIKMKYCNIQQNIIKFTVFNLNLPCSMQFINAYSQVTLNSFQNVVE